MKGLDKAVKRNCFFTLLLYFEIKMLDSTYTKPLKCLRFLLLEWNKYGDPFCTARSSFNHHATPATVPMILIAILAYNIRIHCTMLARF